MEPKRVWDIIRSTVSYIFFSGTYTHTLIIFAFCNIDDVGWGTKGLHSSATQKYRQAKLSFVSTWILVNAIIAYILVVIDEYFESYPFIIYVLAVYSAFIMIVRFLCASIYHFKYYIG